MHPILLPRAYVCTSSLLLTSNILFAAVVYDPVEWRTADGGNGHQYRAVFASERLSWTDAKAMAEHGIRLGWKAGANALSIAELVIAFALIGLRNIGASSLALRAGADVTRRMGRLLTGRVVGLHGCGHIGQQVVRLLNSKSVPYKFHILDNVKYRKMGAP